jgi:hypothetical protein
MSAPSSPKVAPGAASPKVGGAYGSASPKGSPKAGSPKAGSPKAEKVPEIDMSLEAWIYNIRTVLHFPAMVITVISLLISGSFIESASRKSLEMLDNVFGKILGFALPIGIAYMIDWQTGLLAAAVSLILFARLQRHDTEEGFLSGINTGSDSVQSTKIVSNTHRWFVEKVLGEMPLAISSDRIQTKRYDDNDTRTSSSSSMSSSHTSDSSR